jgi:hypothetical protein
MGLSFVPLPQQNEPIRLTLNEINA